MKSILVFLSLLLFASCSRDFINVCDQNGTAFQLPKAAFTSTKNGATITLKNDSEFGESYLWEFGDGTTSTETNPTKTFPQDKSYTIKLLVKKCEELESEAVETIDMKCEASSPIVTAPASLKICQGESIQISASCNSGTLIWSNGSTLPSQTISSNEAIFVQCTKNGCYSTKSTVYNYEVIQKPAAPTISATNASICEGNSTTLNVSQCNIGIPNWSNLKTERSILVNPVVNTTYTAKCSNDGCSSASSNVITINVNSASSATTLASTNNPLIKNNLKLNGEIKYNSSDGNGSVSDHGFIYLAGTSDPKGNKNTILKSLGKKTEVSGNSFSYSFTSGLNVTYRAYVKSCNGDTVYGNAITSK